ncbi:MAG: OsmC family protein [Polyangiaceae bacterium]|nr:OsmC family protein [Polyangiaceae bacterium]
MVKMSVVYTGELRCRATHGPSSAELTTDAPRDNHGKGEAFSPTDTLATALATCMLTVMGIEARKAGYDIDGMEAAIEKHMTAAPPRKVAKLVVDVSVAADKAAKLDAAARAKLEQIGETCPVRLSLSEAVEVVTNYRWG